MELLALYSCIFSCVCSWVCFVLMFCCTVCVCSHARSHVHHQSVAEGLKGSSKLGMLVIFHA